MKNYQNISAQEGYLAEEVIMTNTQAMIKGGLCSLPFLLILGMGYRFLLLDRAVLLDISGVKFPILFLVIIAAVTVMHELLHGIGWAVAGGRGWSSVRFQISGMMPVCACSAELKKKQYLAGVLAPFVILGTGSVLFLLLYPGTVSILVMISVFGETGADLLIALHVMKEDSQTCISDHPEKAGYTAYKKRNGV